MKKTVALADVWNIIYSTEILALLFMIINMDINISHALI